MAAGAVGGEEAEEKRGRLKGRGIFLVSPPAGVQPGRHRWLDAPHPRGERVQLLCSCSECGHLFGYRLPEQGVEKKVWPRWRGAQGGEHGDHRREATRQNSSTLRLRCQRCFVWQRSHRGRTAERKRGY